MFDQLSERLQGTFRTLQGKSTITDDNIEDAIREVRRALLEADVSLRVIKGFISKIKDRAIGEDVIKNVDPGQQFIKIVNDELVILLGGENKGLVLEGSPALIMMFGLQGSGKTTSSGKLALKLKKEGKSPLLVACDVYRPAAVQQLITLGKQIDVPVHAIEGSSNVQEIAQAGLAKAKADNHDVVIIDTAGRLQVDTEMMAELLLLERVLKPKEKLLVIDSMTGQEAVTVAETFNTQLDVTGIVMTKLDGDARGGSALSVVDITGKPIKFIGNSEKLSGLEPFHPERMASRILGMGDVLTLVEKAQEAVDLEDAKRMEEKIRKQSFSLDDFMKLQKQLKMLGGLDGILNMLPIPGIDKEMKEMISHGGEQQIGRIEAMVNSMTPAERDQPELLNESRRKRISKGCGITEAEIEQFLKQFEMMKMMMKQMTKMSDKAQKQSSPKGSMGLSMPRSKRKKKNKNPMKGLGNFPGMPPGGLPKDMPKNLPGGFPGNFPGLGGGGNFPF